MANDKKSTRDYVIEMHADLKNLKDNFNEHKKNHKFIWVCIIGIPSFLFTIFKIVGG